VFLTEIVFDSLLVERQNLDMVLRRDSYGTTFIDPFEPLVYIFTMLMTRRVFFRLIEELDRSKEK
jgi:uncharacterized protein (DUF58 family)